MRERVYYFLRSGAPKDTVRLLEFCKTKGGFRPCMIHVQRGAFEVALQSGAVRAYGTQRKMPPWLPELDPAQYRDIDAVRPQGASRYRDYVEQRYAQIAGLVKRMDEILGAPDPMAMIGAHARSLRPEQNAGRVKLWFFTYITHACNIWALMRANHEIGHWDRGAEAHAQTRFGRPGLRGRGSGYSAVLLRERMVNYYLRHAGLGVSLQAMHRAMLREEFGCKVRTVDGVKGCFHPEGLPFPTYMQFWYAVQLEIGPEQVKKTKYGAAHMREKVTPSKGRFTHELANLLEKIELDAFYVAERPRSVLDDREMEPLAVVRIICPTSGEIVGIGFSLGAETSEAYRMAMFSAVIAKSEFCQLFGITNINDDDWPAQGLPGFMVTDRGPGASSKVVQNLQQMMPVRQIAPSYQGQSKASIESSHPRKTKILGAPTHRVSDLDVIGMVRKEIYRANMDNHTSNIGDRLLGLRDGEQVVATPHHAWNFLSKIGRTAAFPMAIDEAVRTFLTPVELILSRDELRLLRRVYDSPELRATGIYDTIGVGQSIPLKGYCLSLCVRHCWVEVDNKLIKLTAKMPLRVNLQRTYVAVSDLTVESLAYSAQQARQREHATAAAVECAAKYEEETGLKFNDSKVVGGAPRSRAKSGGTAESDTLRGRAIRKAKAA
ncbi:hypothetical protein GALL_255890 [mine drainage metagenome]|uniref:Integrase catalytic domain-containing protein n=1 Tax=mine drainage metagenome TaxID=410659 RepID=A0A1J5RSI3_9ZZZZ